MHISHNSIPVQTVESVVQIALPVHDGAGMIPHI